MPERDASPIHMTNNTASDSDSRSNSPDYLLVGTIARCHGLKGFWVVRSYTDPFDSLASYEPWLCSPPGSCRQNQSMVELDLAEIRVAAKHLLVRLEGIETLEAAQPWCGRDIYIPHSCLPDDAVYWHDLIGMQVFDVQGRHRGEITRMEAGADNDLMMVGHGRQRMLVPYIDDRVVKSIDWNTRTLIIDWPMPDEYLLADD